MRDRCRRSSGAGVAALICGALAVIPASAQAHRPPELARIEYEAARALALAGDIGRAIDHYNDALRVDSEDVEALFDLAWLYATSDRPEYRDASRAVVLAEKLVELTHYKQRKSTTGANWPKSFKIRCSHVLATAFASAGNFQWAAEYARQAFAAASKLAGDSHTAEAAQLLADSKRLKDMYEAGQFVRRTDARAGLVLPPR